MKEPEEKTWQQELEELQAKVDILRNQLKKLQSSKIALQRTIKTSDGKRKKGPGK
ncbi:MAG: hypothetical protein JWN25_1283 [Verrucomicrobiales bacterium]|nr:hypothetical protein [Verrucomicrobiales bacterium]